MRSLFADPLRLLARWAIKRYGVRVVVFASMPTRREFQAIVRLCMGEFIQGFAAGSKAEAEHRTSLH
jgi:hypothetical protein